MGVSSGVDNQILGSVRGSVTTLIRFGPGLVGVDHMEFLYR